MIQININKDWENLPIKIIIIIIITKIGKIHPKLKILENIVLPRLQRKQIFLQRLINFKLIIF